jgi:hypothetical protein
MADDLVFKFGDLVPATRTIANDGVPVFPSGEGLATTSTTHDDPFFRVASSLGSDPNLPREFLRLID